MKFSLNPLLIVLALAGCCNGVFAQTSAGIKKTEAPLQGHAWQLANQAYKLYEAGRYAPAAARAQEAMRLRPDVLRLRLLQIFALQKLGKLDEAMKAADAATQAGLSSPELEDARKNLKAGVAEGNAPQTAAYRKGFPFAQKAYAEYQDKAYAASERNAETAFRTDPQQGIWALLWIAALEAQQKYQEAMDASDTARALGAPNTSDLLGRRQSMQRMLAEPYAIKGYQALIANNPAEAVPLAREAVELAPGVGSHRLLLITVLMLNEQLQDAETAATDALEQDDEDTSALVLRGYLKQRQGKTESANTDFDAALKQDWLSPEELQNLRLIAADASVIAGDSARVKEILAPLDAENVAVKKRLQLAQSTLKPQLAPTMADYPLPLQDCRNTPYGTVCQLLPADAQGNTPSSKAYAAYGRHEYQEAIDYARDAVAQEPDSAPMQRLLTTTLAAGTAVQQSEALKRINEEMEKTPRDADLLMQRGYLHINMKKPSLALDDFRAARATGKAPPAAIVSEGFAQGSAGDRPGAIATLKSAIDMADEGKIKLTDEERLNTRGGISGFSREWGATVSLGYRGARPAGAIGGAPLVVPGDAVFSTAEVYWRPWNFLNTSTRTFELYGRLSNTLYNGNGKTLAQTVANPCGAGSITVNEASNSGISGFPTTVGALGMRFTPDTSWGLTFGLERQFFLGSATRQGYFTPSSGYRCDALQDNNLNAHYQTKTGDGGWLAYVSYGYYFGTDRKLNVSNWLTVESYAQAGYAWQNMPANFAWINNATGAQEYSGTGRYKRNQAFASAEMRVGRSFRMDAISDHLVIFPYAVFGVDWLSNKDKVSGVTANTPGNFGTLSGNSSSNSSSWSGSAGVGVNVRYWFREDRYHSPRSYVDWSTQYRFNVGGGQADRAKGLFMNFTFSY